MGTNTADSTSPKIRSLTAVTHTTCRLLRHCRRLSGTVPSELGAATSLLTLALNHNELTFLPTELGLLTALTTLYLQHNNLGGIGGISGALPTELSALTALTKACAPPGSACAFHQTHR
jgi:Leucine-rich repeat (LRR) protein